MFPVKFQPQTQYHPTYYPGIKELSPGNVCQRRNDHNLKFTGLKIKNREKRPKGGLDDWASPQTLQDVLRGSYITRLDKGCELYSQLNDVFEHNCYFIQPKFSFFARILVSCNRGRIDKRHSIASMAITTRFGTIS